MNEIDIVGRKARYAQWRKNIIFPSSNHLPEYVGIVINKYLQYAKEHRQSLDARIVISRM